MTLRGYGHAPRRTPLSSAARSVAAAPRPGCDGTAVGVIVYHPVEELYLLLRAPHPVVYEPLTLHHPGPVGARQAAHRALDRFGLTVSALLDVATVSCADACAYSDPLGPSQHTWSVLMATATGRLEPFEHPTHVPTWVPRHVLQEQAERTRDLATGRTTLPNFLGRPGLRPVWLRLLLTAELIDLPEDDLVQVDALLPGLHQVQTVA